MSYQKKCKFSLIKTLKYQYLLNKTTYHKIMPSLTSLTTSNCNLSTSSQQDKFLLKKSIMNIPMDDSTSNINKLNHSSLLSPESVELSRQSNHSHIHHHHHHNHHNHVRRLSTLDCYTLKNEIVKLNPKSSYCFDNNTYDYSNSTNWCGNIQYHKGDLVCYNRQYYEVIQDVLSEEDQTPDIANEYYILIISRVSRVASKRVLISKWNPYCRYISKGEQVYYDGKVWTALVSQNYEENRKKNPLFALESPDHPSQKGLWEIENYNIDELEIVEDIEEFSEDETTSNISSDDSYIDTNSIITERDESFVSTLSSTTSTINSPNILQDEYIKESHRKESDCSDKTIIEKDYDYYDSENKASCDKKIQEIKRSEIQITLTNQSR